MYSFLIVAIGMVGFALFSALNMGTWGKLAEGKAEVRATKMLIEHACKWQNSCPDDYQRDVAQFGFWPDPAPPTTYQCTYTKTGYLQNASFLPVLASKTKNSYFCLGRTGEGGRFEQHGNKSVFGCYGIDSKLPHIDTTKAEKGAVVICQKLK